MPFKPRDEDAVYWSIRNKLTSSIGSLTNFVEGSFNYVWTRAFASTLRENEIQAAAAQLSGWIEYAGGPITQSDLEDLGLDNVDPEEINLYMEDEDLDELVQLVGVDRDPGTQATATVRLSTSGSTTIPRGTTFGTRPTSGGEFLEYETVTAVSANTDEETEVVVEAAEVGEQYNVDPATITYMPDPPAGVNSVTNITAATGGTNRETNDELRERAKRAVFSTTGGGTTDGMRGYIEQNTTASYVRIYQQGAYDSNEPVEVIVDGGDTQSVEDAIDHSRPVGVDHILVRPNRFLVDIDIGLEGRDINTDRIENRITQYISGLGVNEKLYRDKVVQIALNADIDAENVEYIDMTINGETFEYSEDENLYQLRKWSEMDPEVNITEVRGDVNGEIYKFDKGVDYELIYDRPDGSASGPPDTIQWNMDAVTPDAGSLFYVDYRIENDLANMGRRDKAVAGTIRANPEEDTNV